MIQGNVVGRDVIIVEPGGAVITGSAGLIEFQKRFDRILDLIDNEIRTTVATIKPKSKPSGLGKQDLLHPMSNQLAARIKLLSEELSPHLLIDGIQLSPERGRLLLALVRNPIDAIPVLKFSNYSRKDVVGEIAYKTGGNFSYSDLRGANLIAASIPGVNLDYAVADDADASDACLVWAKLTNARFRNVRLLHSNLAMAEMTNMDLGGSDIEGAGLGGADLRYADLRDLKGWKQAHLRETNIYGVKNAPVGFIEWALQNGAIQKEECQLSPANK